MKKILIPTDYSDTSMNAACYAIKLAKQLNAKAILFHAFHIPIVPSETPVIIVTYDELEKDNIESMKSFELKLRAKVKEENEIKFIVRPGFVTDVIQDIVEEENIDLIVMGITGTSKLNQVLIGSNTTAVMKNIDCPTLAIPNNSNFKTIQNIAFACDLEKTKNSTFEQLKTIVGLFKAKLSVINVVDPSTKPNNKEAFSGLNIERILQDLDHTLYFTEESDVIFAINEFIDKHSIDLLIMLPRKHSFIGSLFHKSNTKQMAFHSHIPLLAIHE
jgi:nucleotide-binding universal stress UspA family protein